MLFDRSHCDPGTWSCATVGLLANWAFLGLKLYEMFVLGIDFWFKLENSVPFVVILVFNVLFLLGLIRMKHHLLLPLVFLHALIAGFLLFGGAFCLIFSIGMTIIFNTNSLEQKSACEAIGWSLTMLACSMFFVVAAYSFNEVKDCIRIDTEDEKKSDSSFKNEICYKV